MDAIERTKSLGRFFVPVADLIPNPHNPNEMTEAGFNLLYDNIGRMGMTDPVLVRPHPDQEGKYRIVGGEHRWEVAKLYGFEEIPCTIVNDDEFDDDQEKFQLVRHNIIHGKMSPQKFMAMYESLSKKYTDEIVAESFGFESESEFNQLVNATAKQLPKEMQKEFKDAAKEIKTIDGLAELLNRMFAQHGDTLPYGYMIVDFGGVDSYWLRMLAGQKKNFLAFADVCRKNGKTVDHFLGVVLQSIAMDTLGEKTVADIIAECPDVVIAGDVTVPTLDFLDEL